MIVNLKNIPILWINLEKDKVRYDRMVELFKKWDLSNNICIKGIEGLGSCIEEKVAEGCALSQVKALKTALESLEVDTPVLILEDDIEFTADSKICFEIPDDSDAVYLGISHWGCYPMFAKDSNLLKPTTANRFNQDYYLISQMLSTHAILYVSNEYKKKSMEICQNSNWHCDIDLANNQENFRIYTPISPYFIQNDYPNKAVTSAPLFLDNNNELKPVFMSWWFKNHWDSKTFEKMNDEENVLFDF